MSRMNILNAVEQEAFESAPVFNSFQRKQYFDFPQAIQQATANLRTPANQLCFLLSCGYFKASKRFFPARTFHPRDVEYVVGRTGLRLEQIELHLYAKETSSRHRGFILDFYGFKPFRPHGRPVLAEEIARLLRSQIKPKVIFWRCVDVLIREKIEVPGYFPLADQILSAIKTQNQTLAATIERTLGTATRAVLDDLLRQEPLAGDTVPGKTALYQALKAFGQVPKSLFILQVIDDPVLRQAIEKQLDRIEHAHRFTRAVSVGNPREFLQAEKEDQEMAEACKRLIKNCIICWNYLYLSQKLEEIEDAASRQVFLDAVAHGSVISWQHINLLGEYDFSDEKLRDSVGI